MTDVVPIKRGVVIIHHDADATAIGELYRKGRSAIVDSVRYMLEAGDRLIEKKKTMDHGEWLPWLNANADVLGFDTDRTAQRLIKLAKSNPTLTSDLEPDRAIEISRDIWNNNGPVRGTGGTGENEWFTPPEYLDMARAVLGGIDLDPASSKQAQAVIKADRFYTKASDGLAQEWRGRVWLNPPYAQPLIAQFIRKLIDERDAGRITAAIVLTHNYTDTAWFHELATVARAVCFTRGRVKFYEAGGGIAAPTQGQAFTYIGNDLAAFRQVFSAIGFVASSIEARHES